MKTSEFETNVINKKVAKVFDVKVKKTKHKVYQIFYRGKYVMRTYNSFRRGDLHDNELKGIKKQLKLDSRQQLFDLNGCPLSAEDYLEIVKPKLSID